MYHAYTKHQTYKNHLKKRRTNQVRTVINVVPLDEKESYRHVTYQQVMKSCGRKTCTTCYGQLLTHGPYWQCTEWDETSKKQRTTYVGKKLPPQAAEALAAKRYLTDPKFRKLVHSLEPTVKEWGAKLAAYQREINRLRGKVRRLTEQQFRRVFIRDAPDLSEATRIYHQLALKYHPDHNPGTAEVMKDLNALWHAVTSPRSGIHIGDAGA